MVANVSFPWRRIRSRRPAARTWQAASPRAAVVLIHGFSATAEHLHVGGLATLFHERSLDVISYDARGHGGSGGESTLGDLEQHDVAAAVDVARVRADRVVLVAASMGAIGALRHAVTDPTLAGVVSVSCPARWRLPRNARGILSAGLTRTWVGRVMTA